ncbi:MAG: class I SAM-dependent methyltransferase [Candidatus Scalindua sp.]|jgi:hypothetical protein|nr:class I SAM-dependent methyltransferase [Candidatus Scalindua sp.]
MSLQVIIELKRWLKRIPGLKQGYVIYCSTFVQPKKRKLLKSAKNIERELRIRSLQSTVDYVENNMIGAKSFRDRYELLTNVLDEVKEEGLFLEFGVFKGNTISHIASRKENQIYGFDSFEGLPEYWRRGFDKGHFKTPELPKTPDNVTLIEGWFSDSLPGFLDMHKEKAVFIHIDCDLYSSTKTIFDLAGDRIEEGTILVFDEYFNYPGWRHGEYKAFQEFCEKNGIQYSYLGYCRYNTQVVVKILVKKY